MRRHAAEKREITPDAVYDSVVLSKFINKVMRSGKKHTAENIVYKSLEALFNNEYKNTNDTNLNKKEKTLEMLTDILRKVKPLMEVRSRRVGGATYPVPSVVRPSRAEMLAMQWIITGARQRKGMSMFKALSEELILAMKGEGHAFEMQKRVHAQAAANKAFEHLR